MRFVCPNCGGGSFKMVTNETGVVLLECLTCHKTLIIDIPGGLPERKKEPE
jgi:hypothetical protein